MRKWHRWMSVIFAVFLLFIAATGLLSHFAALWPEGPVEVIPRAQAHEEAERAAAPPAPRFVCPPGWRCRPAPPETGPRAWVGFFHHLHSGEEFGPAGTAISILSGLALLFFAFSGLWMYVRMWRERARRVARGGAARGWFWP